MFERIVLHEKAQGLPGSSFDFGFLAETMLFYGHAHVVVGRSSLRELLHAFGPETLIEYLRDGHLTMTYTPNMLAVVTQGGEHDLDLVRAAHSNLQDFAGPLLVEMTGKEGRGRRLARRLRDLVNEQPVPDELPARARQEWEDVEHVERCVKAILEVCAPTYVLPRQLTFRLDKLPKGTYRVATNLDFERAGAAYNEAIPASHSSLTEAQLLANIAHARRDIEIAAEFDADFAANAVSANIIGDRLELATRRAAQKEIASFQDVTLDGVPSLRQVINGGQRTFQELRPLLERAKQFREWLAGKAPNAELVVAYYQEVARDSWADKLPAKALRFVLFSAIGLGIDALGAGGLGTIAGLGVSAADTFVLDRLVKGWKPNQFVEGPLRDFLRDRK